MECAREQRSNSQGALCLFFGRFSQDIIIGFHKAGIDIDDITSIQRRASNNSWVVTFGSKAVNDAALNEHSISITGCSVLLGDGENCLNC